MIGTETKLVIVIRSRNDLQYSFLESFYWFSPPVSRGKKKSIESEGENDHFRTQQIRSTLNHHMWYYTIIR